MPVSISLPPSSNISNLRSLIEEKMEIKSEDQRLIYRGKMLDDTKNKSPVRIKDVGGLSDGCTIHLVPRSRPKSSSDPLAVGQSVSLPSSPNRGGPEAAEAASPAASLGASPESAGTPGR
jgi:hypothetical protein